MEYFNDFLLKEQNTITIFTEINSGVAKDVISKIRFLEEQGADEITLLINTPGGSINDGLAIYDVMKSATADIKTIAVGMAASMGAFLLSGGTRGKRYAYENAEILIHQPLGGAQGQATEIEIACKHIIATREKLNRIMAKNTSQPIEIINQATERDNILSAAEAKEFGLIDHVITLKTQ